MGDTSFGGELVKIISMKTKLISPVPSGIPDTSVSSSLALGPSTLEPPGDLLQCRSLYTSKGPSPGFLGNLHLSQSRQVFLSHNKA